MGIDQSVVFAFLLIALIVIIVFSIDLIVPIVLKLEFDDICRHYLLLAESQNGLSTNDKMLLENKLTELGLETIHISSPNVNETMRGDVYEIDVHAVFRSEGFVSLFKRESQARTFLFKRRYIGRKIIM
jgi:hypothetical protein